ncbi:conserved hypothetical protein [Cellulomonas flavigena DSM 20109]|uniref:Uncharacterized protein n=1 Tax=Cellulomonas flavigena (strain ATCC 482 / DSM 20109 / BCRC 11376 / JCM 18109 / NBRC 3775 / NCIMB 8073 / NRS 134) TaxID=446466 RepID=D5UIL3_CELFN|nr:hypothetical protein [Cellulomonas flavigena]ADG73512.1 conserved hypothetical protein [Cellulomonas flavigena DSM 20109]
MSLLADVVAATGRGAGPATVARELGVDVGLVETVLDHATRVGLLQASSAALGRTGCTPCPPRDARPPACTGCPLTR